MLKTNSVNQPVADKSSQLIAEYKQKIDEQHKDISALESITIQSSHHLNGIVHIIRALHCIDDGDYNPDYRNHLGGVDRKGARVLYAVTESLKSIINLLDATPEEAEKHLW